MHSTLKQGWEATAKLQQRGQEEELSLSQTSEPTEAPFPGSPGFYLNHKLDSFCRWYVG